MSEFLAQSPNISEVLFLSLSISTFWWISSFHFLFCTVIISVNLQKNWPLLSAAMTKVWQKMVTHHHHLFNIHWLLLNPVGITDKFVWTVNWSTCVWVQNHIWFQLKTKTKGANKIVIYPSWALNWQFKDLKLWGNEVCTITNTEGFSQQIAVTR